MKTRRALSPVLGSLILVAVGIALGGFLTMLYSETAFGYVEVDAIEYSYVYSQSERNIENVRWKVNFGIVNRGTQNTEITQIFILS